MNIGFLDFCCMASSPYARHDDSTDTFECDYDTGATSLYQAIENRAWLPALEFFDTGKWQGFMSSGEDPLPPERQARTWVTRFESDGKVRWSQLPIHAALIFGAPFKIVSTLVTLYPTGVKCTDDQHMLPLHLAIKFGADDNIVRLLIEHFPEAICTSDIRGRLPTQMEGPRLDRTKIMHEIVTVTTKTLQKKFNATLKEELAEAHDDLALQTDLNAELESQKHELELKIEKLEAEVASLRQEAEKSKEEKVDKSKEEKPDKSKQKGEKRDKEPITVPVIPSIPLLRSARSNPVSATITANDSGIKKPVNSFVFGKKIDEKEEESCIAEIASKPESPKKESLKKESIDVSSPKANKTTTTKKVPRRGFFKGFGAKE